MNKAAEYLSIFLRGRLVVEGSGRTFAKAPVWLLVLAGISSLRLAVLTAVAVVAFGMKVRIQKA